MGIPCIKIQNLALELDFSPIMHKLSEQSYAFEMVDTQ